jgi:hypothetical protein
MDRTLLKVALADILLIAALASVLQDLQGRSAYAASLHTACSPLCSYVPSFSYTLMTRFFTMTRLGTALTSPPILDWVQVLGVALVVINFWFAYSYMSRRKAAGPGRAAGHTVSQN